MKNKAFKKHIIPGFGLSLGVTVTMLSLITVIPLASVVWSTTELTAAGFIETVTRPRLVSAFRVSLLCSFAAASVNLVMGVLLAWVLVRYDFPGKRILDGLIELPLALPTAIAGITLTSLTVNTGWVGGIFAKFGIGIAYTRLGIVIALIFVGIPFVARTVQPVLEKLNPSYEEAAGILGATKAAVFFRIILPEITPAALCGFGLAFARGLGEYGSVVFIAGNRPFETEIAPLLIFSQLQEYDYAEATAIALIMLALAFMLLFLMNLLQSYASKRAGR